ncbi:hypothetical protein PFICI_06357 [Pestalotiopsis fici W106-1]|uniref:FAD dependent oxidoreductase domain-containing protein n=1 Tax=Pestalotiopsis fici (strain W106-1 / CGMCC3.15140) TaxID=1229662 RepID=W3X5M8_PESFW|nr:uncharacterized protein PFICI_06357 [Pestalotiopsis fici W106-1]ETS81355.1 hypothetical protein PFICI_06357 [Pestalotiopsis fici W106-1]
MAAPAVPVQNPTVSFWRTMVHPIDDQRTTSKLPDTVDVIVIGAGYAGISVMHHMLELAQNKDIPMPSILLLEAREACSGATGRNGGHLKPDVCGMATAVARNYGLDAAIECARFEQQHVSALKELIESEDIDCDLILTRCIDVFLDETFLNETRDKLAELKRKDVSMMSAIQTLSGTKAEQVSGVKGAKGCITYPAGHLHPYKLLMHLLSKALDMGVNLQTHTCVKHVTTTPDDDGYATVTTDRGKVRAKQIVYATNAYTAALLPELKDKIIPVRGTCCRIVPKTSTAVLKNSCTIRRSSIDSEYLVPLLDGSLVVGGGRVKYYHNKAEWYDNVADDELMRGTHPHFDGYMQRHFHGWEDSEAETQEIWTGIMGHSADGVPFVGNLPDRPNQFIIAGFSGHGMPQAYLAAKGLASMIIEGASFHDTKLPKVFEASTKRLKNPVNLVLQNWQDWRVSVSPKL